MRQVFIVAVREFAENAKTKGFWIGIFLLPAIFTASVMIQHFLDDATPTRHFVLVDRSGAFEQVADTGVQRLNERDLIDAFNEYVRENAGDQANSLASGRSDDSVDEWVAAGGIDAALDRARAHLAPDAPELEVPRRRFQRVPLPESIPEDASLEEIAGELKPYLRGVRTYSFEGEEIDLFAAVLVPAGVEAGGGPSHATEPRVEYWSINLADESLLDELREVFDDEARRSEYLSRGVDVATVREVQRTRVPFTSLNPKKQAGSEEVGLGDRIRQWAPVVFVYLLWIGIFTISQMLLNNMIEEKSNRIIEVLLSSVTATELMLGKLFGIAAVGLTMLTAWIGSAVLALSVLQRATSSGEMTRLAAHAMDVLRTSGLLPAFLIYFLLGYLMYAAIFLTIGSLCNTLKEAQNLMGPVMLIMIVPLFTMMFIPKEPNGTLATILSWIPLYTPFVMMNRAAADPPLFDLIGTLVLLVFTTLLVLWLSGKIFRVGILRTGQPPKLLELVRWVRG